jgi:excisionase family DNA binding protein
MVTATINDNETNIADWCTLEETLELLQTSERSFYRRLRKQGGPEKRSFPIAGGGAENRYRRADVMALVEVKNKPAVFAADSQIGRPAGLPSMLPDGETMAATMPAEGMALFIRAFEVISARRGPVRRRSEMMTVAEAADYLKMTPGIIRRLIAAGSLRSFPVAGVAKVFKADVDAMPPEVVMELPPLPRRARRTALLPSISMAALTAGSPDAPAADALSSMAALTAGSPDAPAADALSSMAALTAGSPDAPAADAVLPVPLMVARVAAAQ